MRYRTAYACFLLLAAGAFTACDPPKETLPAEPPASIPAKSDSEQVKEAFEQYRTALLNQDGKAAAESVSLDTIELYQDYRDLAVSGDEPTVKALSMINRMQVLLLRHRMDPSLLHAMDGKNVFAHTVDENWIGKEGVVRVSLGEVIVNGPRATARLTLEGEPTSEVYHFTKEADRWSFDLVPTIQRTDQLLQQAARSNGLSENEFIFSLVTSVSGRKVTDTIWLPLE